MKKGIPARELRPFSIDDPFGLGIETPSQRKLQERFHRKVDHKRAPAQKAHPRSTAGESVERERRPAPAIPSSTQTTAKKSSAWGCLFTLVFIGVLWTIGQMFVPLIVGAIQQEIVLQTGQSGYGRILKAHATDISLNESTVYELTVEIHLPGTPPYQVEFKQGLAPAQAALAQEGTWTTLRYDQDDRESIVLERLGVDPADLEPAAAATNTQPRASHDPFLKVDVRATAQVSTQSAPAQNQPPAQNQSPAPATTDGRAPNPNTAPSDSTRTPQASGSSPSAPAPAPNPEPAVAQPAPQATAETAPAQTVLPICRRAAACCTLAGGASCGQFVTPGKEKRECNRAFNTFNKQATAAGKACQ